MSTGENLHQLAAIISGDIVGYSRLIGSDEDAAVRLVTAYREEVELLVKQHQGKLVDFTGDNFLAYFSSSLNAVRCGIDIQQVLRARNHSLPDDRRMQFRLGIHQGEIRIENGRVFGTGVNVAARLEPLAEPGGICISGAVRDELQGRIELHTIDLGTREVKNIAQPVVVHRLIFGEGLVQDPGALVDEPQSSRLPAFAAAAVVLLVLGGVGGWQFVGDTPPSSIDVAARPPAADGAGDSATRARSIDVDPGAPRPSIVVLPFLNLSGDQEQEFFADGITEDLTTDLAKIPQLFVIARNSAFTYKGTAVDVEEVGRELGVRYALEGSVRKVQQRVRITAQLIDASTGFHVWSQRYDRDLHDIFAVQAEISEKILSALQINIEEAELARIRRQPVENLNAYQALLRGRTLTRSLGREGVAEGRRLFEHAIKLHPNYGEAYASLAQSYMAEFGGWNLDLDLPRKAAVFAEKALELSPLSPLTYSSLAAVELGRFRPDKAIEFARRSVDLAPSTFEAHSVLGAAQIQMGLYEDAKQSLEQAVRLNPKAVDINYTMLGFAHYRTGSRDKAVELWERVRAENRESLPDRLSLAQHYQNSGQSERARAVVAEILTANPYYTAEKGVQMLRLVGGVPPEMESVISGNFKLAGLP